MSNLLVYIAGVNGGNPVSVKEGSVQVDWKFGQRATAEFVIDQFGSAAYRVPVGAAVTILDSSATEHTIIFGGTADDITEASVWETEGNPSGLPAAFTQDVKCVSWEQRLDKRYTPGASALARAGLGSMFALNSITRQSGDAFDDSMIGRYISLKGCNTAQGYFAHILVTNRSGLVLTLATNAPTGFDAPPYTYWDFPNPGTVFRSFSGAVNVSGTTATRASGDPFDACLVGQTVTIGGSPFLVWAVIGSTMTLATAPTSGSGIAWSLTWTYTSVFSAICAGPCAAESIGMGTLASTSAITQTLTYDNVRVSDALTDIATRANYIWFVDVQTGSPKITFVSKTALTPPYGLTDAGLISSGSRVAGYRNIGTEITRVDVRNAEWLRISVPDVVIGVTTSDIIINLPTPISKLNRVEYALVAGGGNGDTTNVGIYGQDTGKDFYYLPGFAFAITDPGLSWGAMNVTVTATPCFQDTILSQDSTAQSARAAIEGGSGIYEHSTDESQSLSDNQVGAGYFTGGGGNYGTGPGWTAAVAYGTVLVNANKANVTTVTFECDAPGFLPGQYVSIQNTARNLNGSFLIDEIQFKQMRRFLNGSDYYSGTYQITCLSNELQNWLAVFQGFVNGGSGSSGSMGSVGSGGAVSSAGQYSFEVADYLAVDSSPCSDILVEATHTVSQMSAVVKQAPTGGGSSVTITVKKNGSAYGSTLTIAAGTTTSNVVTAPGGLTAGDILSMQVTGVGSTAPGAYLTVVLALS